MSERLEAVRRLAVEVDERWADSQRPDFPVRDVPADDLDAFKSAPLVIR